MSTLNHLLIFSSALIALSSTASAFFLNWGSQETSSSPVPQYYYHQRFLNNHYAPPETLQPVPMPSIPSIPIQVPLQAQLSAAPNIHNVQLVPCLCPVSQDFDYDKVPQENIFYANPNQNQNQNQQKPNKQP